MKTLTLTVGALLVALASGCSLQPVYQQPDSAVPALYPAAPGAPAEKPTAAATDWRQVLTDARLQRLVELGLHNNRDLRVAMLNVERVQAQYRIARSALAPQIGAQADMDAAHTPDGIGGKPASTGRSYSAGLTAAWELDLFGRLRSQSDSAFQQYLASGHARQAAEILLISQIADQYLTTLADDAQLKLTLDTRTAAEASYQLVKLQYDTGTVSELDLRLARTTVDQADANYQAQLRLRAQAENALVLLVGQALPADLPPPGRLDDNLVMADMPAGLPSDLLLRRPDILQAEAQLRAEHADIGAARAAFFPNLSLTATAGSQSASLGGLFAAGTGAWTLLPALTMPIFNAGANQANLDVAMVSRDIGVAQYQKAVQTAFREVADGLAARGTYTAQLAAQQRETADQQRRLELENMLYKNGVDSYQNVLSAQTALYTAQQSLLTARLNQLTSLVDLYRALGGGWRPQT
ncbi:efflux transporter outer membrane subunit [Pseudoduganella sp. FT26W]|uniref:Efflux transporter outer membrane subunit n=1 Tax=Duganella aquatilis TaxID=2666082 RepID=A0A844CS08_9BURK|nr:efflux transporter outer membrane subunit [Duganella aquatilis]MRW82718.1 efflux transporter outer membrane subunit [Duganella aquatilis]